MFYTVSYPGMTKLYCKARVQRLSIKRMNDCIYTNLYTCTTIKFTCSNFTTAFRHDTICTVTPVVRNTAIVHRKYEYKRRVERKKRTQEKDSIFQFV